MRQSVAAVDQLLASLDKGEGAFSVDASDLIFKLQGKVYPQYSCIAASGTVPASALAELKHFRSESGTGAHDRTREIHPRGNINRHWAISRGNYRQLGCGHADRAADHLREHDLYLGVWRSAREHRN